jgi:hypothetical protein
MNAYSTRQAAKKLGISFTSLNRYIAENSVPAPPIQVVGVSRVREWTEDDIERVREILPKIANGRKTRHKKKPKKTGKK